MREKRNAAIQSELYKGIRIEYNVYGTGEYVVCINGEDYLFRTKEKAKEFINGGLRGV